MRALFFAAALLVCIPAKATLVFSENVGTPSASDSVATYSGWQNNATLLFTGNASVGSGFPSTGYANASGAGNVSMKASPAVDFFQISKIDTSTYDGTFTLTFGAFKSIAADTMANLVLDYSSDGTIYTPISIPLQTDGTATWRLLTFSNIALPAVSNLRLRWTNTAPFSPPQSYQLDDIALSGTITAVPEASSFLAVGLVALGAFLIRKLKAASSQSHTRTAQ